MTPAQRHRIACEAISAGAQQNPETLTAYQHMQKQLAEDKALLKNLAGIQDKVVYKAQALPRYQEWVQGVMEAGEAAEYDTVTPAVLIWTIDCGLLDDAMPLARFCIARNMQPADGYQRNLPTVVLEEGAAQLEQGAAASEETLHQLVAWATEKDAGGLHAHNIPDPVRAKLLKAAAERVQESDPAAALAMLEQALAYHDKAGVKKQIDTLKKSLDAAAAPVRAA